MSRVYWHTREHTAELHGSERAWLAHVSQGPAEAARDLGSSTDAVERAIQILEMVPPAERSYLGEYLRAAQAAEAANRLYYETSPIGVGRLDVETGLRLVSSLATNLRVGGLPIEVAGQRLHTSNVDLNTALVAGSDAVRLAAKIHGWCESHAWVDELDHEWLARIIEDGLRVGIFRAGMWSNPVSGERKWHTQGWEDLLGLLRTQGVGPVVMSFSVGDSFPNGAIANWTPPEGDPDGDTWYDLPDGEQWDLAFTGLQTRRPWAQLSERTLTETTFGHPVSWYDLFTPDRERRVRRAVGDDAALPA